MKKYLFSAVIFCSLFIGCRYDDSDFSLDGNIREYNPALILTPAAGDTVYAGSDFAIRWSGVKSRTIRLELWKKKQYLYQEIASKADNTGEFLWKVPLETTSSVSYQVKLINYSNREEFVFSEYFIIRPR